MKGFRSKGFGICLMIVNFTLIICLVAYIIYLHSSEKDKKIQENAPIVYANGYTDAELQVAMEKAGDDMISIYGKLLPGSRADFSDGNVMQFLDDGVFNGYFDQDNTSITGTYAVLASSDDNYLADVNIYNGNSSKYVRYKLMYDDNKDFMLYCPAEKSYIVLTY